MEIPEFLKTVCKWLAGHWIALQGQRQERQKNAIEHFGRESVSMRLAGAHELVQLAKDNEASCKMVLDVICDHVRGTTGEDGYQEKYKAKPSVEVQRLLTLLFVQDHQVFKDLQANLQGSFLNGADLKKAHLPRANLKGAHLQEAELEEAHLPGANLEEAHLQRADLKRARLQRADLRRAHLQEAVLGRAHLQGADLREARLPGAVLEGARLLGAVLEGAHLQGADLRRAHLQGAGLHRAHLHGAYLYKAHLQGSALYETHLQAAALLSADLRGAGVLWISWQSFADRMNQLISEESNLSGVVFEGGLSQEDVDSLVKDLSDKKANELRIKLERHVGLQKVLSVPPKDCGVKQGAYFKAEAEQWIAKYNEAMSEVPEEQ